MSSIAALKKKFIYYRLTDEQQHSLLLDIACVAKHTFDGLSEQSKTETGVVSPLRVDGRYFKMYAIAEINGDSKIFSFEQFVELSVDDYLDLMNECEKIQLTVTA